MFLPREPVLLRRRDNLAVHHQRRRRIVIKRRNAKDRGHGIFPSFEREAESRKRKLVATRQLDKIDLCR